MLAPASGAGEGTMNDLSATLTGIGQSVRRREDLRLLTGNGRYTDDFILPGQMHAYVLRSPHAHAKIARIDTHAATATVGVAAVLTAADYLADGLKPMAHAPASTSPPDIRLDNTDGSAIEAPGQMPLAQGRVRFVGEPVALVVAETLAQAKDAAEMVRSTTVHCRR
jgi:aerobic carbon-monoxide dehydrogenase large subunit